MSATVVRACNCHHAYQDETYGVGQRVHNQVVTKAAGPPQYRCTVCARVA
jgi:hypothetical protein